MARVRIVEDNSGLRVGGAEYPLETGVVEFFNGATPPTQGNA
jgi:hypothetical protein